MHGAGGGGVGGREVHTVQRSGELRVRSAPDRVGNMDDPGGRVGCALLVVLAVVFAIALSLMLVRAYARSIQRPLPILPRVPELPPVQGR